VFITNAGELCRGADMFYGVIDYGEDDGISGRVSALLVRKIFTLLWVEKIFIEKNDNFSHPSRDALTSQSA